MCPHVAVFENMVLLVQVRKALWSAPPAKQLAVLQALRWRIVRSEGGELRRQGVWQMARHDVFGFRRRHRQGSLLEQLLGIASAGDRTNGEAYWLLHIRCACQSVWGAEWVC